MFPSDATELEPLLEKADQDMYVAKRERKGRGGEPQRRASDPPGPGRAGA